MCPRTTIVANVMLLIRFVLEVTIWEDDSGSKIQLFDAVLILILVASSIRVPRVDLCVITVEGAAREIDTQDAENQYQEDPKDSSQCDDCVHWRRRELDWNRSIRVEERMWVRDGSHY